MSIRPDRRTILRGASGAFAASALAACTGRAAAPSSTAASAGAGRALLVYFSRAGENYADGGRVDLEIGNTAVIAGIITDLTGIDSYEIRAGDPYPDDYEETVRRNSEEQNADARPDIADALPDLAGYDTVILGSPVWNVRAPMIMRTFIEAVDLSGRTVLPLVTYAVSGMGRVADDYTAFLPDSTIGSGLAIRGEDVATDATATEVEGWLRSSGLLD